MKYKIVAKVDPLAVHSTGYYGDQGKEKAQCRVDSGECAKYWQDKAQAAKGFEVVEDIPCLRTQ